MARDKCVLPSPVPPVNKRFFAPLLKLVAYPMQLSLIFSALYFGDMPPFWAMSG